MTIRIFMNGKAVSVPPGSAALIDKTVSTAVREQASRAIFEARARIDARERAREYDRQDVQQRLTTATKR